MNFDHIPAKAEMLTSDVALVLSDPRWAAARLAYLENEVESLQRERDELKAELAARIHNYEYWREYAESLKATAITPEMRAQASKVLKVLQGEVRTPGEHEASILARDLLGEKDA